MSVLPRCLGTGGANHAPIREPYPALRAARGIAILAAKLDLVGICLSAVSALFLAVQPPAHGLGFHLGFGPGHTKCSRYRELTSRHQNGGRACMFRTTPRPGEVVNALQEDVSASCNAVRVRSVDGRHCTFDPEQETCHVTVAFRPGYGDGFATPRAALEYANEKMQRLLAEYENDRKTASTCEGPAVRSVYRLAASSARDARGQLRLRDDSRRGAARRSARHKTRQKARQDDSFLYLSNCL